MRRPLVTASRALPGRVLALAVVALLALARPAAAYLDPGSGSYLLQLLLAGLLSALVTLKIYWRRLREWIGGALGRREPRPPAATGGRDERR